MAWRLSWKGEALTVRSASGGSPPTSVRYLVKYPAGYRDGYFELSSRSGDSLTYSWREEPKNYEATAPPASGSVTLRKVAPDRYEGSGGGTYPGRWVLEG